MCESRVFEDTHTHKHKNRNAHGQACMRSSPHPRTRAHTHTHVYVYMTQVWKEYDVYAADDEGGHWARTSDFAGSDEALVSLCESVFWRKGWAGRINR